MNNKGFAISSILYTMLLLFVIMLAGILSMMSSRKILLDKTKKDVLYNIENKKETFNESSYLLNHLELFYDSKLNIEKIEAEEISKTTFYNFSGENNNGKLKSFDFNINSGWVDNYLKFDGLNDVVDTNIDANDFYTTSHNFTMSMLVKINKVTVEGNTYELYDASTIFGATYYNGYGIIWNTSNEVDTNYNLGIIMSNINEKKETFTNSTNFGIQQITFVYDFDNEIQKLFVDGIKVREIERPLDGGFLYPVEMANICLGGSKLYGGNANNVMTDMNLYTARIYNRALNDAEVKREYRIDKNRYEL